MFLVVVLPKLIWEEIAHVPGYERLMEEGFEMDLVFFKVPQTILSCIGVVSQVWGSLVLILTYF